MYVCVYICVDGWVSEILCSGNLSQVKTFTNFAVLGQFAKVLSAKIFIGYRGGCVIILDNGDNIENMDVASLSLARQHLSNGGFPNSHVDMVPSINGHHFVAL